MTDPKVLETQQWLNATYHTHAQWKQVTEDGFTGWGTIFGLIRGLQIELGISTLADNFGTGSMNAFVAQIGAVSSSTSNTNVIHIAQSALWCKGYIGGATWGQYSAGVQTSVMSLTTDMGLAPTGVIGPKVMKSLLSMDAYVLISGGTSARRSVQQWLNGKYSNRSAFNILPCDGLYSRNTQQGMMYAIQYELGMSDSVANGNFGPGTQTGLRTQATVSIGSVDAAHSWVRLFQGALRFNDYDSPFTGTFDSATQSAAISFQTYAELVASGTGDYRTWASLLISTGDETRPGIASDMATQLNASLCASLYSNGYRTVGRYLSVTSKRYLPGELQTIFSAGLKTFPIMQEANTQATDFTDAKGRDHGFQAVRRLRQLGFKQGTTVFFAVDYDATDDSISSYVIPYFQGVKSAVESTRIPYEVGVYGTRNVCARVINAGLAAEAFIASMSWGWSGNLGYKLPPNWSYDQIQGLVLPGTNMPIDKNVQSVRASPAGANDVLPTPLTSSAGSQLQFQEDYYWYITELAVRAEMAQPSWYPVVANDFVLNFLQKPTYWTGGGQIGNFFRVYTPLPEDGLTDSQPQKPAVVAARASFESTAPQPSTAVVDRIRHWAATTRAYLAWGVGASGQRGVGDYGGWAGDLAKSWQEYMSLPTPPADIRAWIKSHVGTATPSEFGAADLIEDIDGFLCADMLTTDSSRSIADCVREIEYQCGVDPSWRYKQFYARRFGNNPDWIVSAVVQMFTVTVVQAFSLPTLFLIDGTPLPSESQAVEIGLGFADVILAKAS